MPFGPKCEYKTFADCVRANQDKDDPQAYCGALERDTSEHCSEDSMKRRPIALPERPKNLQAPDEPHRDWYRINRPQNQTDAESIAELYIYDEISWWGVTADDLVRELAALDVSRIDLHLNSPGGDAWDGVAIYNALLTHPAYVDVIVDGLAASAASMIAMAGDNVRMATGTSMMIHDAIGLCFGPAADMERAATMLNSLSNAIAGIYMEKSGIPVDQWREAMLAETWYSPQEAVDAGLADEVVSLRGGGGGSDAIDKHDLSQFRYAGRASAPKPRLPVNSWSASEQESHFTWPIAVGTAKKMYAIVETGKAEDGKIDKQYCHLPHHNVSEDGTVGEANPDGVSAALSRVNQVKAEGKDAAKKHLKAHQGADSGDDSDADDLFEFDVAAMAEIHRGLATATEDDFERAYDPDVLRAAITERANNAPATPDGTPAPVGVESPVTLEAAKALGQELWEALQ